MRNNAEAEKFKLEMIENGLNFGNHLSDGSGIQQLLRGDGPAVPVSVRLNLSTQAEFNSFRFDRKSRRR